MARAIAAAEQAEFARLMQGERIRSGPRPEAPPRIRESRALRPGSKPHWTEMAEALLRQRWAEGVHWQAICAELGVDSGRLFNKTKRLRLGRRYVRA
jgi:hypothetical protein